MKLKELESISKKFVEESEEFMSDFTALYTKWLKKSPRITLVNVIHLPLNVFLRMLEQDLEISTIFPELPDVFIRCITPFIILRKKWGQVPNKEFLEEYIELYDKQFDEFFASEEQKQCFKEWFEKKQ